MVTRQQSSRPFGIAKLLSWSSLALILVSGVLLSIVITNTARNTLLTKQKEFALLLAENLNHQIYRRFTLPTIIGFGRIALKQKPQYERLDQVVESTIHGLRVQELRIYDFDKVVSYSTNEDLVGKENLAGMAVVLAMNKGEHSFEIKSKLPPFLSLFQWETRPGSVILKTVYPLRAERGLVPRGDQEQEPIMGVLEFYQDITDDYRTVIRFQWMTIGITLFSSLLLFLVLLMIIRRADRVNEERVSERERLERELHQSEKLASMGRMVAGIAHEIRNPLGIIRSSAELLLRKPETDGINARIVRAIYDEAKRLSQTVNDFLDYARPKQPKQEPLDLSNVLDQVTGFLESEAHKRDVTVEKLYMPGLRVKGDKDLLYRAFYNVLINALQAIGESGIIRIGSESVGREVVVTFDDSGPGFDKRVREKLLDPFFTTKDDGTGLGLTIVTNIIASHGGEVELDESPHGGARVRLKLPKE